MGEEDEEENEKMGLYKVRWVMWVKQKRERKSGAAGLVNG